MTARELRLRTRIDMLVDRVEELEERLGHCAYCGHAATNGVCHAHSDLRALDPGLRRENWKLRAQVKEARQSRDKWKNLTLGYELQLGIRRARAQSEAAA